MAVMAAGALVLSACTSGTDTEEPSTSAPAGDTGTGDGTETSSDGMASSSEGGEPAPDSAKPDLGDITTQEGNIYYSVGADEWAGYNGNTADTNSVYNAVVNARLQEGFWYFGNDGTVYPNEDFGTYEKTSDDPLTVEYTISDAAVWEDGTPITYDDFLYDWASQNPTTLFPEADYPTDTPVFNNVADGAKYYPDGPVGEAGGKTFTVTYPTPYPDWLVNISGAFPAHVVARESGLEPAALTQAILDKDAETVASTAEFWNTGWLSPDKTLPDPALVPSNGPYSLDASKGAEWNVGQYLTLGTNDTYYGTPPATSNLTFRFTAPENQVQALQNGDLNIIEPQATVDTVQQIQGLGDGFTLETGSELTWEHLDYNFGEGSIFSEAQGGLAAREAFALCVPRQQIIDNLIKPIAPDAVVMNLRESFPFQDNYQELVDAAYDGRYDQVDIEGAKAKFAESGLDEGAEIRLAYNAPNQRRTDEVGLIKSSCEQVGFTVTDAGAPTMFEPGGALDTGDFEIALFAWAGSGLVASGEQIYVTDGSQNNGKYSNETVDAAWTDPGLLGRQQRPPGAAEDHREAALG